MEEIRGVIAPRDGGEGSRKRNDRTFWGQENVLYLDGCGLHRVCICICQKQRKDILTTCTIHSKLVMPQIKRGNGGHICPKESLSSAEALAEKGSFATQPATQAVCAVHPHLTSMVTGPQAC